MDTIVTVLHKETFEEYIIGLPNDLDEYFITLGLYEDWKNNKFFVCGIKSDYAFHGYDETISLNNLNRLLYEFQSCTDEEQERILAIAEMYDDTYQGLWYAVERRDDFDLLHTAGKTDYEIGREVFYKHISHFFLPKFEDVLDLELFTQLLLIRGFAYNCSRGFLLKTSEIYL